MKFCAVFLLILSLFRKGISHDDGASTACAEMASQFHSVTPSACSSDYMIVIATTQYSVGQAIPVTVRGIMPDMTFRGIFLQARDNSNTIVGSWTTNDPLLRNVSCGGVTHNSQLDKNSVEALWHAPTNFIDNIEIQATIAKTDSIIFVNCYSVILTQVSNDTTSTAVPLTTQTTTLTSEPPTTNRTSSSPSTTTRIPSPTTDVSVNVSWAFDSGNITRIHMAITNLMQAEWAAVGLSLGEDMGKTHVFICRRLANDTVNVNRYINPDGHSRPVLAGSEQGGIFMAEQEMFDNGVVYCQFTLSKFNTLMTKKVEGIPKLSQSTRYHPLFAIGQLDSANELKQHADNSRTAQSHFVQLNREEIIGFTYTRSKPKSKYVQAHGSIMIFTWILIASTGMIFARYFKNSWPNNLLCGKPTWYAIHRTLMSATAIFTVLGFMFIFVYTKGGWVKESDELVHAIVGIIVLGLAFFQPFIALFRCETDSPNRFIFNYLHACVGFVAFVLSTVAIFLATVYFTRMFTDSTGWIIMIVWTCWIVTICVAFEYVQRKINPSESSSDKTHIDDSSNSITGKLAMPSIPLLINNDNEQLINRRQQRFKNILLGLHVLVAFGLSLTLVILILQTD